MDSKLWKFCTPFGVTVEAFYREGTNDWNTLRSCLHEDEYRITELPQGVRLDGTQLSAIDIGGHIGGCTLSLLARGYRVVTVEPLPENVELLRASVTRNGWDDRWRCIHGAITDVGGQQITVLYGDTATDSGAHHEFIGVTSPLQTTSRVIKVRGVTLNELIESAHPCNGWIEAPQTPPFADGVIDFLKIDCEGAEWAAFRGVHPANLAKVKRIAAELHPLPETVDIRTEFATLLHGQFNDDTADVYPNTLTHNKRDITNAYYTHI